MFAKPLTLALIVAVLCPALALAAPTNGARRSGRMTLDVYQADVRNVLRLLADVGGVNIVVAEEVTGTVSLKLRDVAWRDALATVLAVNNLEAEERSNVILVASAATFAKRRAAALTQREQCLASAPLRTSIVRLSYANAADMAEHARATLTSRGSVSVDARTNSMIVRDVVCP